LLDLAVTGVSAPTFVLNLSSFRLTSANAGLAELVGIALPELLGRPCMTVCAGQDAACQGAGACPVRGEFQQGAASVGVSLRTSHGMRAARLVAAETNNHLAFIAVLEQVPTCAIAAEQIHVRALGSFDIRSDADAKIDVRRPQSLALLKMLLMGQGHAVSDDTLISALWPDGAPPRSRDSLRVLVHDLRRALEPALSRGNASRFIVRESGGYVIPDAAPISSDVDEFDRTVAAGSRAGALGQIEEATTAVDHALRLYRGPLFEGDELSAWFMGRRNQLHRAWLSALTLRAALFARAGDIAAAIRLVEQATDADPSNEQAHRLHLLLVARHQGRTAALHHYVVLTGEFRKRFGVAPSRETADLAVKLSEEAPLGEIEREYWPLVSAPPSDFPFA
jgi:DNA-binding SARP family transcriptional activator